MIKPPSKSPNKKPVIIRVESLLTYSVKICKNPSASIGIARIDPRMIMIIVSHTIDFEYRFDLINLHNDRKNEPDGCRHIAIINTNEIPRYIPIHLEQTGIWLSLRK